MSDRCQIDIRQIDQVSAHNVVDQTRPDITWHQVGSRGRPVPSSGGAAQTGPSPSVQNRSDRSDEAVS